MNKMHFLFSLHRQVLDNNVYMHKTGYDDQGLVVQNFTVIFFFILFIYLFFFFLKKKKFENCKGFSQ